MLKCRRPDALSVSLRGTACGPRSSRSNSGRWGANLHLIPLLAAGAKPDDLGRPLGGLNALTCGSEDQLYQLVENVSAVLETHYIAERQTYAPHINTLANLSRQLAADPTPLTLVYDNVVCGEIRGSGPPQEIGMTISLTLVNESALAVTPDHLSFRIEVNGRRVVMRSQPVSGTMTLSGAYGQITLPDAGKYDFMMRVGALLPGSSFTGIATFTTRETTAIELFRAVTQPGDVELHCVDIRGAIHRVDFVPAGSNLFGPGRRVGLLPT